MSNATNLHCLNALTSAAQQPQIQARHHYAHGSGMSDASHVRRGGTPASFVTKHRRTPTWYSWQSMLTRCLNVNTDVYPDYGGRGITVCARWRDFENFLADMGSRPDGLTLDRIDVNGNYESANCRWATIQQQNSNRRPPGKSLRRKYEQKHFLPDSEQFVPSSYAGLSSASKAIKYAGCEYANGNGGIVRRLSEREIEELHRHIARLKGELVAAPMTRRAIV